MSKLPNFRRIYKEDYPPEIQDIIEKLAVSLNIGLETLYNVLNQKVSLEDNIDSSVRELDVVVDSSGFPVGTASIRIHKTETIRGLSVIKADNLTNAAIFPTSGAFLTWVQEGNLININHIAGLPEGQQFRLKIVAFG